jgi:hypothetical protein
MRDAFDDVRLVRAAYALPVKKRQMATHQVTCAGAGASEGAAAGGLAGAVARAPAVVGTAAAASTRDSASALIWAALCAALRRAVVRCSARRRAALRWAGVVVEALAFDEALEAFEVPAEADDAGAAA